ncbi:MAG TPA: hypothetical protein VIH86_13265 [Puia sp.]|jgi:hypothetical protein
MKVYLWLAFVALAAVYLFSALNRSNRVRKENRQERLNEKQKELLQLLKKKDEKENETDLEKNQGN